MTDTDADYDLCSVCFDTRADHNPETFVKYEKDYEPPTGALSVHEVEEMVKRYGPQTVPPCRVCGAGLGISTMDGSGTTVWHCDSPEVNLLKLGVSGWKSAEFDHYRASEWKQTRHQDSLVMRLLEHGVSNGEERKTTDGNP